MAKTKAAKAKAKATEAVKAEAVKAEAEKAKEAKLMEMTNEEFEAEKTLMRERLKEAIETQALRNKALQRKKEIEELERLIQLALVQNETNDCDPNQHVDPTQPQSHLPWVTAVRKHGGVTSVQNPFAVAVGKSKSGENNSLKLLKKQWIEQQIAFLEKKTPRADNRSNAHTYAENKMIFCQQLGELNKSRVFRKENTTFGDWKFLQTSNFNESLQEYLTASNKGFSMWFNTSEDGTTITVEPYMPEV